MIINDEFKAFTKLVLLLATLSFGAEIRGKLYFDAGKIDKDGVVTIDVSKYQNETEIVNIKDIDDYKALSKEEVDTFNLVATDKSAFDSLKTTKPPTLAEEIACPGVTVSYADGIYGMMGFTTKAVENVDLKPSITWFFKNSPSKIEFTNMDNATEAEKKEYVNISLTQTCVGEANIWSSYALARGGVADAGCYSNDKVPVDNKCNVDGGSSKTYLKGYRVGLYYDADVATMKKLVSRFGAVGTYKLGIIIGWEKKDD
ncbi:MAG: hypothetical protein EZS28_045751, partial [Streblomastix strix]